MVLLVRILLLVFLISVTKATDIKSKGLSKILERLKGVHKRIEEKQKVASNYITNDVRSAPQPDWRQIVDELEGDIAELGRKISSLESQLETDCQCGTRTCPSGWTKFRNSCFRLITDRMTWNAANHNCKSLGGYLAQVNDEATDRFLVHWISDQYSSYGIHDFGPWLGATDKETEGEWVWEKPITYRNWLSGGPNGLTTENCLHYYYSNRFLWNDASCSGWHFTSVCQI